MEKLREEFEQIVGELEWQDVADTLQELCSNILCDTTNPPHPLPPHPLPNHHIPPPPPSAAYSGRAFDAHGDVRGFAGRFPLRPPFLPHSQIVSLSSMSYGPQFNPYLIHPFHISRQVGAAFRQQSGGPGWRGAMDSWPVTMYVPCQMPPQVIHSQPAYSFPPAPPQPKKSLPVVPLPEGATLRAVGMLNGEVLYAAVDASQGATAPPPPSTSTSSPSRKRKYKRRHKRARGKKPPNAFMCFLREQRPTLKAQIEEKGGVAVNKLLGQLWASLSKEQRAKYYEQAYAEKKIHKEMSSDCSSSNDEGANKRRRNSDTVATSLAARQGAWDTQDDPSPSTSFSSSSSSSLSSWLEAVITTEAHDSPAAKCPNSGDESDIEGMDAQLLHLLGCC
ncbi:transcription factor 7-like 1-C isoform X2 [Dunckerocampus dactyliophorus]|uniref:transcription factor 7-like 1-C isoform X2 n=1 Tax=Dunckerocampus dactyliophorus TaxID=161453 RepID=UPI002405719A|nr:transcription factor 7-like 1-C isoform X2 [Dunckerocampus dactyliophorus]